MDLLLWAICGVLPAVAAVLFGVGVCGARWLALALAVAICVPLAIADGLPPLPWRLDLLHGNPRAWLWWLMLGAGLVGVLYDLRALPHWLLGPFELALVALLPWLLSAPLRSRSSFERTFLLLTAGWLLLIATWLGLKRASRRHPGLTVPLAMTMVLAVDAWLLRRMPGGTEWQLAGVAAVATGFAMVTTIWRRHFVCGTGSSLCITLAHVGMLWCGRYSKDLTRLPFVLATLAPLPLWLVSLRWFERRHRLGATLGVLTVGAVAAAAALTA